MPQFLQAKGVGVGVVGREGGGGGYASVLEKVSWRTWGT